MLKWSELPLNPAGKILRQFAVLWIIFFLAVAGHRYWGKGQEQLALVLAVVGVGIGGLGLIWPRAIRWIFVSAMIVAFPLGWLLSNVMLGLMFFGIITPLAMWFRWRGRDTLERRVDAARASYWTEKKTPDDLRSYFRQY